MMSVGDVMTAVALLAHRCDGRPRFTVVADAQSKYLQLFCSSG
jgi:hypothetical protein